MNNRKKLTVAMAVTVVLALGVFYIFGHEDKGWVAPESAKKQQNPIKPTPESIQEGKTVYEKKCLSCHGETGKGDGPVAELQKDKPRDLTDAHMMSEMTDGELFWKISTGKGSMPKFEKTLSKDDRWNVINYVRTFAANSKTSKDKK